MPMQEDLYDSQPGATERPDPEHGEDDAKGEPKTTLINSEICPDAQVGDEITIRVEKKMEKQFSVSCVDSPKEEKGDGEAPPAKMPMGGGGGEDMYS